MQTKLKYTQIDEFCQHLGLSVSGQMLAKQYPDLFEFIQQLLTHQQYPDAVQTLAYALPKREATWWACVCAREALTESSSINDRRAIELAESWVKRPTVENCRETMPIAQQTQFDTPASWAAVAAFWSGDNLSPVVGTIVTPPENLYAKAVIGAVMLAATAGAPSHVIERYEQYLRKGLHIANGGNGQLNF